MSDMRLTELVLHTFQEDPGLASLQVIIGPLLDLEVGITTHILTHI